jgi:hypothetical protein
MATFRGDISFRYLRQFFLVVYYFSYFRLFLLQAIYLDAVCLFSGDKVEEIVDIMTEKEIRLQIPLEEVDILMEETQDKKNEEETQDKKKEEEPK